MANDSYACDPICGEKQNDSGPVEGVSLTSGGSCYAKIARLPPDIHLRASPSIPGSDAEAASFKAQLKIEYTELCGSDMGGASVPIPHWTIAGADVEGGKGYAGGEKVSVSVRWDDVIVTSAAATVLATGGVPTGIAVSEGGHYFKEDRKSPGYASPVIGLVPCEVEVDSSGFPTVIFQPGVKTSAGGAIILGVVDTKATSESFGQVIGLEVEEEGERAIGWGPSRQCYHLLNGIPLTLAPSGSDSKTLVSFEPDACYGSGACAVATPVNQRFEPTLRVYGSGHCTLSIGDIGGPSYGCGADIEYESGTKLEDDDPTRPIWFAKTLTASGGTKYSSGFPGKSSADFLNENPITRIREFPSTGWCSLGGSLPTAYFSHDADGELTGAYITSPGAYYAERKYLGEPVPIQRVTLVNGGGGYAKIGRIAPTLSLAPSPSIGGIGVTLTPMIGTKKDECKIDYWYIESVKVSGGVGYETGPIEVTAANGTTVGEAAAITLVAENGIPVEAVVKRGGKFWQESKAAQPYVSEMTTRILQLPPSKGIGAAVEFAIDDDPYSPTFGNAVSAKVVNGGGNYTLLGQSGCAYTSDCGFIVRAGRDQITLSHPGMGPGTELLMAADGIGENCATGLVVASPTRGWNPGATASIAWPSPSTEQCGTVECYSVCPTMNLLCISVEVQTPFGNTITKTLKDFLAAPGGIDGTISVNVSDADEETGAYFDVGINVGCDIRGFISVNAGFVYFGPMTEDSVPCYCTSGGGCVSKWCNPGNWWDGEYVIPLRLDGIEYEYCSCCCPDPVGLVTVTISTPEDVAPPC